MDGWMDDERNQWINGSIAKGHIDHYEYVRSGATVRKQTIY